MSFIDPNAFYQEEIILLDKNFEAPTPINEGLIVNGNLQPWRGKIELTNTGNELQNNGVLVLRIPPDGTFVRKEPILIDESAKDDYIIQVRLRQDRNKDGIYEEEGRLFRFFIGQPTLIDDALTGETLKITLISVEYHTRETLDAERITFPFQTPQEAFFRRIFAYNTIKGANNTQLIPSTIALPDAESLRQEWRPLAPTPTHDLFRTITKSQSAPSLEGGVFRDFFFDYEPLSVSTKTVIIKAEEEGTTDRGVILDPLLFEFVSGTEKDKIINVDLIKFKNNVIMEGNPLGGTLPMECSKFSSLWEHAKIRPDWDATTQYSDGTLGTNQSLVKIQDPFLEITRFFTAIEATGNINRNPTTDPLKEAYWEEDFVIIPDYNKYASYNTNDIVVQPDSGPSPADRFYRAIQNIPNNPTDLSIYKPAPFGTNYWADTGQTFLRGLKHPLVDFTVPTGNARAGRTQFFSYTPWTSDFESMRAGTLFGINDATQLANFGNRGFPSGSASYQGVVPDWNFVRSNFDRIDALNQYEQVMGKDIIKTLSAPPPNKESYTGARYLVSTTPTGDFVGHANQIAEYTGVDFNPNLTPIGSNNWEFSLSPTNGDVICDQARGVMLIWSDATNSWQNFWNVLDTSPGPVFAEDWKKAEGGTIIDALTLIGNSLTFAYSQLTQFDLTQQGIKFLMSTTFGAGTHTSPLHICKDIKLVEGASGIPGQAFELRYEWNVFEPAFHYLGELGGDKINFNSIGAWWYMAFPIMKIPTFGRDVGDVYQNPVIDSNNLTSNHLGELGWNKGLDSEDLGRIQKVHFKARLSLYGSLLGQLVIGYSDMPMILWAVDIFDRVWYTSYKLRRNGEYSYQSLSFGENSMQQLHHGRYDEYLKAFGITIETDFLLKEKQWSGLEFDWRFVKGMGTFYEVGYNNEGLYVANQFPDYVKGISEQIAGQIFPFIISINLPGEKYNSKDLIVNNARLAIDELHFEKQLFTNSNNRPLTTSNSRAILDHDASEVDYINLKIKAQASRERKKFVEQVWIMQSHGDVRLRFGEKFIASGDRVPGGTQELICSEVKHIIDNDGYMVHITGRRKFVLS